jgi:hypothetical protein
MELILSLTWKIHITISHLPVFLSRFNCGMAKYSEQTAESVHHCMKKTLARFCVGEDHPNHGERLKRAVVEFSSERF